MISILIIDTTSEIQGILSKEFSDQKLHIETLKSIELILERFSERNYDLLIWQIDSKKQDKNSGIDLIEVISKDSPRTQIIIISEEKDLDLAVEGIRAGAYHYILNPINPKELISLVNVALHKQPVVGDSHLLTPLNRISLKFHGIYGISVPMQQVIQQIKEAAMTDISVLITGETGTGKDLVASAIHKTSALKDHPFICVNTGAMPVDLIASELFGYEKGSFTGADEVSIGKFEQANGGTIFLDEIGTMDQKVQVSLLRILEKNSFQRLGGKKNISVTIRIIAATNENLEQAVKDKTFREDLFYRFDVFRIHVPPLRQRPGDISLLTKQFIQHFNLKYNKTVTGVSPDATHYLEKYHWPGNVRELRNTIQRAILLARGDIFTSDLLPPRIKNLNDEGPDTSLFPIRVGMSLDEVEREFIAMTMAQYKGNKSKVAEVLKISRKSLYAKLQT
jgi:DNA-binding NtrC family response regulator